MGRKMIIGVDRLDYSAACRSGMAAFEKLDRERRRLINKVTLISRSPRRGRSEVPEYADIERSVSGDRRRVNGASARPLDADPLRQSFLRP